MWSWAKYAKRFFLLGSVVLALSGCFQRNIDEIGPTQTAAVSRPDATMVIPSTPQPAASETPLPSATPDPAALELGQPAWIGHGLVVRAVFLPGAEQIAIAWADGVSLNEVETGKELWFQHTPTNLVAFDVQPQAEMFAAALTDGRVVVFSATNGEERIFAEARPEVLWGDIAWSPDGQTLAFQFNGNSRNDPIYLLDINSGQFGQVPHSATSQGVTPGLVWTPDGQSISVASLVEPCTRFVDSHSGEERFAPDPSGACYPYVSTVFFPDGQTIAFPGANGAVEIRNLSNQAAIKTLQNPSGSLVGRAVEFPDATDTLFIDATGQWLATIGGFSPCYCDNPQDKPAHPLIVWNVESGEIQAQLEVKLVTGHRLAAVFDGEGMLMFYESGEITRWNFRAAGTEETLVSKVPARPDGYGAVTWSADGSRLTFTSRYKGVDVYDAATQQRVLSLDEPLDFPALSPDGSQVAAYDSDKREEAVYRVKDGSMLYRFPADQVTTSGAFSPDGRSLAFASGMQAFVADLKSGEVTSMTPTFSTPITPDTTVTGSQVVWSPDGQSLVTAFGLVTPEEEVPGEITLWKRMEDGSFKEVDHTANIAAGYAEQGRSLAIFDPSGSRVALESRLSYGLEGVELRVIDVASGRVGQTYPGYRPKGWAGDDLLLATDNQNDTRLVRFNLLTGEQTTRYLEGTNVFTFSPNGLFIAQLGTAGRSLILLDGLAEEITRFKEGSASVDDFGWSPDGRWLYSAGNDGTLKIWPVISNG